MRIIIIRSNIKIDEVDSLYKELNNFVKRKYDVSIQLPIDFNKNYLGLTSALYQFIVTWIRYDKSDKLLLPINNPTDEELNKLYENELIFPLVSLMWNENKVYNLDGTINLRAYLKPKNSEVFDKMRSVKALSKNNTLLLTNFDHLREDAGLLGYFEKNGEFCRNKSQLTQSLRPGISEILNYSNEIKKYFETIEKHIGEIVYELMKNTFEWAKDDENRVPLKPNVRGLLMKFYKITRAKLIEDFSSHSGIADFIKSDIHKENSKGEIHFLEISVFDSGVGFVKKYKSFNGTENLSDVEIVKKCLIKHSTSSKGLDKLDKGIGLDKILLILNKRAFLRIKTGTVCTYRNLITHNYYDDEDRDIKNMDLFDWDKNDSTNYSNHFNAEGTVITIIFPLLINEIHE